MTEARTSRHECTTAAQALWSTLTPSASCTAPGEGLRSSPEWMTLRYYDRELSLKEKQRSNCCHSCCVHFRPQNDSTTCYIQSLYLNNIEAYETLPLVRLLPKIGRWTRALILLYCSKRSGTSEGIHNSVVGQLTCLICSKGQNIARKITYSEGSGNVARRI